MDEGKFDGACRTKYGREWRQQRNYMEITRTVWKGLKKRGEEERYPLPGFDATLEIARNRRRGIGVEGEKARGCCRAGCSGEGVLVRGCQRMADDEVSSSG